MKITVDLPENWLSAFAGLEGCMDNGCWIKRPMVGTNGGCRCYNRFQDALECDRFTANSVVRVIAEVRNEVRRQTEPAP